MAKQPKGELVVIGYNYDLLETKVADKVRNAADRIRERIKKTVEDIIEVGNDLLAVKEALPHGQFLPWLLAEFGWSERSAQNFMAVAEKFVRQKHSSAEEPVTARIRRRQEANTGNGEAVEQDGPSKDGEAMLPALPQDAAPGSAEASGKPPTTFQERIAMERRHA